MAKSCAFHPSATWRALIIFVSMVAVHVAEVGGQENCPPFSCGNLHNISYPFRRLGDPSECGTQPFELVCSSSKATIRISTGTYFVTSINYTTSFIWVVDANLDTQSNCLLPRWDQVPYPGWGSYSRSGLQFDYYFATEENCWACFVNCSQGVTNNNMYKRVKCLSANNSFVYVSIESSECLVGSLEPSCGYLAMIPFGAGKGDCLIRPSPDNSTYEDIIESVKKGFSVFFGDYYGESGTFWMFKTCAANSTRYFRKQLSGASIPKMARAFFWNDIFLLNCVDSYNSSSIMLHFDVIAIVSAFNFTMLLIVLCRFVLPALAVLAFLARKYWKTRITIDAVEKFLQMQQMLGPTRYAYTDITAITSHFRDKLGQGGYGSVYKGTLFPSNNHVAVKMLGNSNCNGDDFISEVSTIGKIHHINVVGLVGFCAEEMRRALVYEYMPHGSLDKFIFSSERSFSWDKLTEIALGIARGISYLHQGCDMQILHFDIKPHNILLDNNFVPKVADFGLAKLYPRDKSFVPASALRGTIGYIAPEMVSRSFGVISSKSDVYSFGMVLLEMAGGRRNADQNDGSSIRAYYPSWVYDRLAEQEAGEITAAADMHELERKLCIVGLRCIQMKPRDRPTMSQVIDMLECGADGLQMPSRPFFCDDEHIAVDDSYHFSSQLTAMSEEGE